MQIVFYDFFHIGHPARHGFVELPSTATEINNFSAEKKGKYR